MNTAVREFSLYKGKNITLTFVWSKANERQRMQFRINVYVNGELKELTYPLKTDYFNEFDQLLRLYHWMWYEVPCDYSYWLHREYHDLRIKLARRISDFLEVPSINQYLRPDWWNNTGIIENLPWVKPKWSEYKQIEYDPDIDGPNKPLAVIWNEYGGRYHINLDDHCYTLRNANTWVLATHIFKWAWNALKRLAPPK
jgi:hypothetical protein